MPVVTDMDYLRGALANALYSGLSLSDVLEMAMHAESPEAFDRAVNILAETVPDAQRIHAMVDVA